jgi:hypothetical protein
MSARSYALWQLPTYGSRSAEYAFPRLNARSKFVQQLQRKSAYRSFFNYPAGVKS